MIIEHRVKIGWDPPGAAQGYLTEGQLNASGQITDRSKSKYLNRLTTQPPRNKFAPWMEGYANARVNVSS